MLNTMNRLMRVTAWLCAVLALGAAFAGAACAQDEGEGGEEEEFYRASDPEDPLTPGVIEAPEVFHNIGIDVRGTLPLGTRSDLDADDTPAAVQLHWLWQIMDHDSWFHVEVGLEIGSVLEATWSSEQMGPVVFNEAMSDYESGIDDVSDHRANAALSDVSIFYGGAVIRLDLQGDLRWDMGPTLSLGFMQATIDSRWACEICDGTTITLGEGDSTTAGLFVRVGGYFGYQFDHVWIGADIGAVVYLGAEPPALGAAEFGISIGYTF